MLNIAKPFVVTCMLLMLSPIVNAYTDAKGQSMGGAGVTAADFLMAPFYNPALAGIYRREERSALLLPSIQWQSNQSGNFKNALIEASETLDDPNSSNSEIDDALRALDGSDMSIETGTGLAFSVPNRFLSVTAYASLSTFNLITPVIAYDPFGRPNSNQSAVNTQSIQIRELGVSLAKYKRLLGQHMTFGITPKLQTITTYTYQSKINRFDIDDVKANANPESHINLDAGVLWFYGPLRAGLTIHNIRSKQFQTLEIESVIPGEHKAPQSFDLNTTYTIGLGLVTDSSTLALDYDVNEAEGFMEAEDNQKMLRVGFESDLLFKTIQIRGGYNNNLANNSYKPTYSLGTGLVLFNTIQTDLGLVYKRQQSLGASANFLVNF